MLLKRKQDSEIAQNIKGNTQKLIANEKTNTTINLWIEFNPTKNNVPNLKPKQGNLLCLSLKDKNHKAGYKRQTCYKFKWVFKEMFLSIEQHSTV